MKKLSKRKAVTVTVTYYIISFFLVAFSITASFFLFLRGFSLPDIPTIKAAAIRTFLNALFISAIFTTVHCVWRHFAVTIPTNLILNSLNEMTAGNFDSEIKISKFFGKYADIAEKLNCTAKELKSVETLKTDFISNVSHEMKTPLANIKSYSELLKISDGLGKDERDYTDAIVRNVDSMSKLISDILRLNKLENNVIHSNPDTFDIGTSLTESLLNFESVWDEKNINLETDMPENVFVTSDKEMLGIIWNNLLSNAFKFTPENGTVGVSVVQANGGTKVIVSDNGIGMNEETKRRVFDKFYQADNSHSTKGNGLGLALAKRAADVAGCTITVESEEGKGSIFTVFLPQNQK